PGRGAEGGIRPSWLSCVIAGHVRGLRASRAAQDAGLRQAPPSHVAGAARLRRAPTADRTEYQRVTLRREGRDLVAETTGSQSSSRLLSLAGAHALVKVPAGDQVLKSGSVVEAMILGLP